MKIDAHQHFWQYHPERDTWIDDSMQVIRRDFMPSDLQPVLEENGMDGCVAVQADQSENETEFLLTCAADNPFVKAVVGWVDLCSEHVGDALARFSGDSRFRGVRHIVQAEPDEFMLREDFQKGIGALESFGLTYDILVYARQLPDAIALARGFPRQSFVLDHIAKPEISGKLDNEWVKNIRRLAESENVYCKLSGMVTETDNFSWKQEDFTPFLDTVTEAFGTNRLMFGSDWPVCLLSCGYKEVLEIVKNYFSPDELPGIMGGNTARFYGISVDPE